MRLSYKLRVNAALDSEVEKHKNIGLSASFMCGRCNLCSRCR